ncbi:hypothetical protein M758_2G127000 [Ceratodon purpureus]|nr:hypothetical protein M758_2G127000 [Ceratodon purpureus]
MRKQHCLGMVLLQLASVAILVFSVENDGSLSFGETRVSYKDSSPLKHEAEGLQLLPSVVSLEHKHQELYDPDVSDHPSTSRRLLSRSGRRLDGRGGGGRGPGRGGGGFGGGHGGGGSGRGHGGGEFGGGHGRGGGDRGGDRGRWEGGGDDEGKLNSCFYTSTNECLKTTFFSALFEIELILLW